MRALRWLACGLFVVATLVLATSEGDALPPAAPEPDTEPGRLDVVQMTAVEPDGRLPDGVEAQISQPVDVPPPGQTLQPGEGQLQDETDETDETD